MLQENNLIINQNAKKATVIWLHGLGATANDFVFFGELFPDIKWILPQAHNRFVTVYEQTAPAWFDIKSMNRQDNPLETGIIETHQRLESLCQQEKNAALFIGGFSQGAAQALYSGLNGLQNSVRGIIAMSGYCPFDYEKNTSPQTLILHGSFDDVVTWSLAQKSYQKLMILPSVSHVLFPCAHGWHQDMYQHIKSFLEKHV